MDHQPPPPSSAPTRSHHLSVPAHRARQNPPHVQLQRSHSPEGQSVDCGLLMGIGPDLEVPVESVSNNGGGGGGENKLGGESLVLETSSSFSSTNLSFSMSNSPPIAAVNCDDKGLNLFDRKNRVPSSAFIESDYSIGS